MPRAKPDGIALPKASQLADRLILRFTADDVRLAGWQDRRERITAALVAEPAATDRGIGRRLGIDHHAVARVRRALERAGVIGRVVERVDALDRRQPVRRAV
jgi:hypothetical protein